MTGDLRPLVLEAVLCYDSPVAPVFTAGHFAEAVQGAFELRQCPTIAWARSVLAQLPYVTRLPDAIYRADLDGMGS